MADSLGASMPLTQMGVTSPKRGICGSENYRSARLLVLVRGAVWLLSTASEATESQRHNKGTFKQRGTRVEPGCSRLRWGGASCGGLTSGIAGQSLTRDDGQLAFVCDNQSKDRDAEGAIEQHKVHMNTSDK